MTLKEARNLGNGLYSIFWKSGGVSLAAVGTSCNGDRWLAPTNWVTPDLFGSSKTWRLVKSVERVKYDLPEVMPEGSSLLGRRPKGVL